MAAESDYYSSSEEDIRKLAEAPGELEGVISRGG